MSITGASNHNPLIGQTFSVENETYTFISEVSVKRTNADIYLCQDSSGNEFVAKYYCNRTPVSVVGYSVYNHYGRGRDGSNHVFQEVKAKSEDHNFIIKHYHRIRFQGSWLVLMDYIDGISLKTLIENEYQSDFEKVKKAVRMLGETLAEWHNNGFAHGDPHLENALYSKEGKVILIDYGQIHHRDFEHCWEYCCIKDDQLIRIFEDFENESNKLGNGFRDHLLGLQNKFGLNRVLTNAFNESYKAKTKLCIFSDVFFDIDSAIA